MLAANYKRNMILVNNQKFTTSFLERLLKGYLSGRKKLNPEGMNEIMK